ncbi:hypothetical protein EG329_005787 [Mollisiaceae sp. DMI_Dod_QoI]|nr:hypothetical protein EG329_005787 [Helotiales sp. DMI_Dod_QoI]
MSSNVLDAYRVPVGDDPLAPPAHKFIIRPLQFSDIGTLAILTANAWDGTPINQFLVPRAGLYRDDSIRTFRQGIWGRAVDKRCLSLVACSTSNPLTPIAYAHFNRIGDDDGARQFVQSIGIRRRLLLLFLSWITWAYFSAENWLWPDRSCDKDAGKLFMESIALDKKRYWESHPERGSRWHAQNIIVSPQWQRQGVGKLLLSEGISRAQEQHVIMGLSASPAGEKLYRKMGFQMLGDFTYHLGGEEGGGIMIWYPEGMQETVASE